VCVAYDFSRRVENEGLRASHGPSACDIKASRFLRKCRLRRLLQEFTAARYIRLRLQRIRTLNADLMMAISEDPRYLDPTVTNRVSITADVIVAAASRSERCRKVMQFYIRPLLCQHGVYVWKTNEFTVTVNGKQQINDCLEVSSLSDGSRRVPGSRACSSKHPTAEMVPRCRGTMS